MESVAAGGGRRLEVDAVPENHWKPFILPKFLERGCVFHGLVGLHNQPNQPEEHREQRLLLIKMYVCSIKGAPSRGPLKGPL